MATTGSRVTVSATDPTNLATVMGDVTYPLQVSVKNLDASITIDLGGKSVAAGAGYPLAAGGQLSVTLTSQTDLWAIAASGSPVVGLLKVA